MSERDERPMDDDSGDAGASDLHEGGTPGNVGALDGAAAAGSVGAVGADKPDSLMPQDAPDPSVGPDMSHAGRGSLDAQSAGTSDHSRGSPSRISLTSVRSSFTIR